MRIGNRIRALRLEKKLSQGRLADLIHAKNYNVANWEQGRSEPDTETIGKLAVALGVDANQLLGQCPAKTSANVSRIPIFETEASAGCGMEIDADRLENYLTVREDLVRAELGANPKDLAVIRVRGDSMTPTIAPGEMVIVNHTEKTVTADGIFVLHMNGALLVKRVQTIPEGLNILSDNRAYPAFKVTKKNAPDDFKICGRVVAILALRKS